MYHNFSTEGFENFELQPVATFTQSQILQHGQPKAQDSRPMLTKCSDEHKSYGLVSLKGNWNKLMVMSGRSVTPEIAMLSVLGAMGRFNEISQILFNATA